MKKAEADNFDKFTFPVIGDEHLPKENYSTFTVPQISEIGDISHDDDEISEDFPSNEENSQTTEEILEQAQKQADELIARAEQNSEAIEQAAHEKGLQKVEEIVQERVNENLNEIRENLSNTIENLTALETNIIEQLDDDLVKLALEIAKKVVRREVSIDREIALTLVQVSLKRLQDRTIAEVHLHPQDYAYVEANREKLKFRGSVELIADDSISIGGCLIHTETGDIDARLKSQFDEISHGLLDH